MLRLQRPLLPADTDFCVVYQRLARLGAGRGEARSQERAPTVTFADFVFTLEVTYDGRSMLAANAAPNPADFATSRLFFQAPAEFLREELEDEEEFFDLSARLVCFKRSTFQFAELYHGSAYGGDSNTLWFDTNPIDDVLPIGGASNFAVDIRFDLDSRQFTLEFLLLPHDADFHDPDPLMLETQRPREQQNASHPPRYFSKTSLESRPRHTPRPGSRAGSARLSTSSSTSLLSAERGRRHQHHRRRRTEWSRAPGPWTPPPSPGRYMPSHRGESKCTSLSLARPHAAILDLSRGIMSSLRERGGIRQTAQSD